MRPAVGPLPAASVVMPRARRVPPYVVGSQGEVKSGFVRTALCDLAFLGVPFVGSRTSHKFRVLEFGVSHCGE